MKREKIANAQSGLAILALFLAVVFFAIGNVLTKVITSMGLPGGEIAFARFAILGIFCLAPQNFRLMKFQHKPLLLVRGIAGGLSVAFTYIALAHLGVSLSKLLLLMLPVFVAIIVGIIWKTIPPFLTIIGLVITTIGVMMIVIVTTPSNSGYIIDPWHCFALAAAFMGAVSIVSIQAIQLRSVGRDRREVDADVLGAFGLVGVVFILPFALFESWILPPNIQAWILIIAISLCSIAGQLLMIRFMREVGAVTFSVIFQLSPVFTVALAWVFLGEVLSTTVWIGAVIALLGVFIATTLRRVNKVPDQSEKPSCEHKEVKYIFYGDMFSGIPATLMCCECNKIITPGWKLQAILISIALAVIGIMIFLSNKL